MKTISEENIFIFNHQFTEQTKAPPGRPGGGKLNIL
jgi:hypothetical protein